MKNTLIIDDYDEPMQSLTFFNFIYNQDDNNNNNDHLLCGIIEDLWATEDSFIENKLKPIPLRACTLKVYTIPGPIIYDAVVVNFFSRIPIPTT